MDTAGHPMHTPTPRASAVTMRHVLAIAVPMTLAYAATPLIGIVDIAVIGQLGSAVTLGAVALGAVLFDVFGAALNFLRMGTTGLVAQAMGAGDREAEALTLWRALAIALCAGFATVALQGSIGSLFLWAMGASAAVDEATRTYFAVRVWGMPLMLANYAVLGWLLGLARAGPALALQLVLSVTNIVLSVALVLGLGWGVAGVAAASVAAEAVTLAAGALVVARSGLALPRLARVLEARGLKRMLTVNGDILIRSTLLIATFSLFTAVGARLGEVTLAANAVLMNLFLFSSYALDGLAAAAEQLGGRAVGAREREGFARTVRLTTGAGILIAAGLSLLWLVAGPGLIALMTTAEDVRAVAGRYLVWAALTPLAGALAFIMDGLFIGATWTGPMRNMMAASSALFVLLWWLLTPAWGNDGLWLAFLAYLGARGLTLWAMLPALGRRTFA